METEDGYEQDWETGVETEDESAEASPQKQVVLRSKGKMTRNMRRAKRKKIEHDQATKSPLLRLGENTNKETHGRSRTPSTEIMSDENALSRTNRQKYSPESTAAVQRKDWNWMRVLDKAGTRVKLWKEEDEDEATKEKADGHSNHDRRVHKKDNKMPKNKNYQCQ